MKELLFFFFGFAFSLLLTRLPILIKSCKKAQANKEKFLHYDPFDAEVETGKHSFQRNSIKQFGKQEFYKWLARRTSVNENTHIKLKEFQSEIGYEQQTRL